jgi:hypothetical protein
MATFVQQFTRIREDCDRAHQARQQLFQQMRARVNGNAQQVSTKLAQFAAKMQDTRASIKATADGLRHGLAEFATDLHKGGRIFRGGHKPRR